MKQNLQQIITLATELLRDGTGVSAPLTLEVGKRYVTRDGQITDPLEPFEPLVRSRLAFLAFLDLNRQVKQTWCPDGCYYADGAPSKYDLVSLYEEPATPTPPVNPPLTLEVGKRYVARDGRVTSPLLVDHCDPIYPFTDGDGDGDITWRPDGQWSIAGDSSRDLIKEYVPNITVSFTLPPELVLAPNDSEQVPEHILPFPDAPAGKQWVYLGVAVSGLVGSRDNPWAARYGDDPKWSSPVIYGTSVGSIRTHYIQLVDDATGTH